MLLLTVYIASIALAALIGWRCAALPKAIATICAGAFCAVLIAGVILINKMAWLPEWMVCDAASVLQASWFAPPGMALLVLAIRRARIERLAKSLPVFSNARAALYIGLLSTALLGAGLYGALSRMLGPAKCLAEIRERAGVIKDGVVLQSTDYTCAPCAAATLLRLSGANPEASERGMIPLCRTQFHGGATMLSIAAGLKTASTGLGLRVRLLEPSFEELKTLPLPAVITVSYGPALGHTVVLCALEQDRARVADPAEGLVWWQTIELKRRYLGEAVTMERRCINATVKDGE